MLNADASDLKGVRMSDVVEGKVKETIRVFLTAHLLIEFDDDIDADSDLFQLGVMDSFSYIETIRFIEKEFAVKFSNEEMLTNVMVSLSGMTSLVSKKLAEEA
jgi:acyl carrier protein